MVMWVHCVSFFKERYFDNAVGVSHYVECKIRFDFAFQLEDFTYEIVLCSSFFWGHFSGWCQSLSRVARSAWRWG